MALIKCDECGESISSSAKVCPHCGIKINFQTAWRGFLAHIMKESALDYLIKKEVHEL